MMIKDSMKKLLLILFVLGIVMAPLVSQEETSEESSFATTKKKVQLWKGEVVGVYKNRLWIKVRIYRNQRISKLSLTEIKSLFTDTKEFPVYQKVTDLKQGVLVVRDTVWEEKHINKKNQFIEVVLVGDYKPDLSSKMKEITTDAYISSYIEEDFFTEPDAFFKGRYTPPRKTVFHPKDRKEMVLVSRGLFLYGQGTDPSADSFNPYFLEPKASNLKEMPSFYMINLKSPMPNMHTF